MSENLFKVIFSKKVVGPIIVIAVAIIIYKLVSNLLNRATIKGKNDLEKKRIVTIIVLFDNIMKYIIFIIAALIILDIYGVNTTSLIAGLGVMGLLVGLSLQDALKDIISGINIIMDNYYVVGDRIKYKDFVGTVISFGLKTTKVKSDTGDVLIVTNRNIDSVINLSQKQTIIPFDLTIATENNHELVKKIVEDILAVVKEYKYVDNTETIYLGIDKISGNNTTYLFQIKCIQGKENVLKREVLEKVKIEFNKNKIKLVG